MWRCGGGGLGRTPPPCWSWRRLPSSTRSSSPATWSGSCPSCRWRASRRFPTRTDPEGLSSMRAAYYEDFRQPLSLQELPEPTPADHGVVIRVGASGICRSDWHGWMGHDPDIKPPHVPGHEFAGEIAALGKSVHAWRVGERVTAPFVCACGACAQCLSGNHQVCERQTQPGFTHWGSFAEYVAIDHAEVNLVRLPEDLDDVTAASLGCRFATSFRAVVDQARVAAGEWVAVHGRGGVGLSAVMIAQAVGANVVAG